MDWAAPRRQYWPEVDRFFNRLPPALLAQSTLLKNNLGTFYADTGQFADILPPASPHHPVLSLHFWLLDDWAIPRSPARTRLEKHLFLAMVFAFAADYTRQAIRDQSSNFTADFLFLAQALTDESHHHLTCLHPPGSLFWDYYRRFWDETTAAWLDTSVDLPAPAQVAAKLAWAKISPAAAALMLNRAAILPDLLAWLDHLNFAHQILHDLTRFRQDFLLYRFTYPILKTMQQAGLSPHCPPDPTRFLGALVLSGAAQTVAAEGCVALTAAGRLAHQLNLPAFATHGDTLARRLTNLADGLTTRRPPNPASPPPRFTPAVDPLPAAIGMAEACLLADPTFRESWEVQRRGTFGVPEMTARAFPAGLIVEILCRHGHPMPAAVADIFDTLRAAGFRYFDYPAMPPDADDLGLLLRLWPYSPAPAAHRAILQTPLAWAGQNVTESGEMPVWFTRQADFSAAGSIALWGQHCVTVEANLLRGVLTFGGSDLPPWVKKSAQSILSRWINRGLSAVTHYEPLYSLWVGFELLGQLAVSPLYGELADLPRQSAAALTGYLQSAVRRPSLTPQAAAFLTLACYAADQPALFNPAWLTLLVKTQRYDGSWAGEPLYGTPTRGELAAWYHSRPVTTAFCYHALNISYSAERCPKN